jgi:hypothetical protein
MFSRKRLLAVLTPVAAVAAIAIAISSADFGSNGNDEQAAAPAPAELESARDDAGADVAAPSGAAEPEAAGEALQAAPVPTLVAEVEGPPSEVARFLREAGFDARVRNGVVEVIGAERAAVELALIGYAGGDVRVVVP